MDKDGYHGYDKRSMKVEGRLHVVCQCDKCKAQPAPVQEPVAWRWHQAPVKTSWGHEMVVADLAIDKDNTVSVYCDRDQTTKVEAMFSTLPAAQRQWVGLTDKELEEFSDAELGPYDLCLEVEARLRSKNT